MPTTKKDLAKFMTSEAAAGVKEVSFEFLGRPHGKTICGCALGKALAGKYGNAEKALTAYDDMFDSRLTAENLLSSKRDVGLECMAELLKIPHKLAENVTFHHLNMMRPSGEIAQLLLENAI